MKQQFVWKRSKCEKPLESQQHSDEKWTNAAASRCFWPAAAGKHLSADLANMIGDTPHCPHEVQFSSCGPVYLRCYLGSL